MVPLGAWEEEEEEDEEEEDEEEEDEEEEEEEEEEDIWGNNCAHFATSYNALMWENWKFWLFLYSVPDINFLLMLKQIPMIVQVQMKLNGIIGQMDFFLHTVMGVIHQRQWIDTALRKSLTLIQNKRFFCNQTLYMILFSFIRICPRVEGSMRMNFSF